ncbi:MAG: hypothetical protein ABWZ64_04020, partial [Xanthobacteraceae bacterium]
VRHVVWAVLIILIAGAPIISYFLFQDDWIPAFYKWIKAQGLIGAPRLRNRLCDHLCPAACARRTHGGGRRVSLRFCVWG